MALNDIDRGREALIFFHNQMLKSPEYKLTFETFIIRVAKKPAIFMDAFGMAIREIGMREGQVEDAMESLAVRFAGTGWIPSESMFFKALSDRVSNPTFGDYVMGLPDMAPGLAMDGFQFALVGVVLDTLVKMMPVFIGIALILHFTGKKNEK